MINKIYLRRKNKVIIKTGNNTNNTNNNRVYVTTMMKNVESLGYTFSLDLIKVLETLTIEGLNEFYLALVKELKEMIGANVIYRPMYINFPSQVMSLHDSEIYYNNIMHWLTGGGLPNYKKEERLPLFNDIQLKVIDIGTQEDFQSIFRNLVQSKTSLSQTDKDDVAWFIEKYKDIIVELLPNEIPLKENVALVVELFLKHTSCGNKVLQKYFKTATDVLRLAVAMCDGDISLAKNTRFKSFKRRERKLLLGLLEDCVNIEEDMLRYKNRWIKLGERLHPSEYTDRYPKVSNTFDKLRNNIKIKTFNGKVNAYMSQGNIREALALLKTRPGDFARKLDYLLRVSINPNMVVNEFKDVAKNVSTPVLLQVMEHFKCRNNGKELRTFFPKGVIANVHAIENNLKNIDEKVCNGVVKICQNAIVEILKGKEYIGNMYIDERLKNYLIPFSQRSASKSLKTIVRGSKIDIPKGTTTIRSFIYWKGSHVDIDLSAVIYDENWNYKEVVSYYNLRSARYKASHSGDIRTAPNGASEFIDFDIESVKRYGGRYVVICLNSYSQQPFIELEQCFMGWMSRENPSSGEIYEPTTVENKVDITSNTSICIPIILDLYENKVIWTDLALANNPSWSNNVRGNQKSIVLMAQAMINMVKPNLYDLFMLHAKARGNVCENIDEADVVFSLDKGVTPFDTDVIIGEYL